VPGAPFVVPHELLGGYDFLRLGSADLQGPFLGVRLWF
jgi:hypothetical protein